MRSEARVLEALAAHVGVDRRRLVGDCQLREELGLDLVDLVAVVGQVEECVPGDEVPVALLARAHTVRELVDLVVGWFRDTWVEPPTLRTGTAG